MEVGIFVCLMTSFCWGIGSLVATSPIRAIGSKRYNELRMLLSAVSLILIALIVGAPFDPSLSDIGWLAASAIVGLWFGDGLLFHGMQTLGARRANLVFMTNVPMTAVLAYVILDERLTMHQMVGGTLTIAAAIIALQTQIGRLSHLDRLNGSMARGVASTFLSSALQAVGVLLLKPVLDSGEHHVINVAASRFFVVALVGVAPALLNGNISKSYQALNKRNRSCFFSATILGGTLGFLLYTYGITLLPAGLAVCLTSLSALVTIPCLAVINRQWPSFTVWAAGVLSVVGVYICS